MSYPQIIINDDESESESESESSISTSITKTSDIDIEDDQEERNLLVTKISDSKCRLTTSLETEYKGWDTSTSGIMFSIEPISEPIELLTIEFQANDQITSMQGSSSSSSSSSTYSERVQVYYRLGRFSGVIDDPSQWTLIADTDAHLIITSSSSSSTAIIPVNEFESVTFDAGEVYSIYIYLPSSSSSSSFIKIKPSDLAVGAISAENDAIEIQTGVSLGEAGTAASTQLFPSSFKEAADFNGIIHYKVTQLCEDIMSVTDTSEMIFNFGVNDEPTDDVKAALSDAVVETLSELFISNDNLAIYKMPKYDLEIEGVDSGYQGSKIERCPVTYTTCSLISTTVWFKYIQAMVPNFSIIEMEVLSEGKQINDLVSSYMAPIAETEYIDPPLSKGEFIITLMGVQPPETKMNDIQKRYFEDITLQFLQEFNFATGSSSVLSIFTATVLDDIPQTFVEEDEVRKLSFFSSFFSYHHNNDIVSRRTKPTPITKSLRQGRRRKLQVKDNDIVSTTVGRTQIITEIAAEGTMQDLRSIVLEGIGNNQDRYLNALITQQMRPGEINLAAEQEGNIHDGDYFSGVNGALVKINTVTSSGVSISTGGGGKPPGKNGNGISPSDDATAGGGLSGGSIGVIVCILLIVGSLLWILYRVYTDCFYSPTLRVPTLNDDGKEEKEPTMVQRLTSRIPKFGGLKIPWWGKESDTDVTTPQFSFGGASDSKDRDDDFYDEAEPFVHNPSQSQPKPKPKPKPQAQDKVDMAAKSRSLHDPTTKKPGTKPDIPLSSKSDHPKKGKLASANRSFRQFLKKKKKKKNKKSKSTENEKNTKTDEKSISDTSDVKSQKSVHSFHNDDDDSVSDFHSDLESCNTEDDEEEESDIVTRIHIDDEESESKRSSSKDSSSDSDSDSSQNEDNQRSRPVAKQKVRRLSIQQVPKQNNKSSITENGTSKKANRHSLASKKSPNSVAITFNSDKDLSVTTNSAQTDDTDGTGKKKPQKRPPRDPSEHGKKRGISTSKSMPLQTTSTMTRGKLNQDGTTKKKDIRRQSGHSTQSNSTRESIDDVKKDGTAKGKKKDKKNRTVDSNHTKDSKNKDIKEPSSDKTDLAGRNKEKKRGIKASKSMPIGKKKMAVVKKNKKAVSNISIDSNSSSSLTDGSGFVAVPFDNISEVSSLSKVGKKKGKKEDDSKSSSKASKSKISKRKPVMRTYSDRTGSKKDQLETKKPETKRRGIKPSKSMPDMPHDSESDSDDDSLFFLDTSEMDDDKSDMSSLSASAHPRKTVTCPQNKDIFKHLREEEDRLMSRKNDKSKKMKPTEAGKSGGKVGKKIKFESKKKKANEGWVWQLSDGHRSMDSSKLDDMLMSM